jgi:hypothetical protein
MSDQREGPVPVLLLHWAAPAARSLSAALSIRDAIEQAVERYYSTVRLREDLQDQIRYGLRGRTRLPGATSSARRGAGHRRSVSALADLCYSPVTVLSATRRARVPGGAASIQVITAPGTSHAAQIASSPQLTPGVFPQ